MLLLALSTPALASLRDARAALDTLRSAVMRRDAGMIRTLYGSRYETADTHAILWDYLERDVGRADAVLDHAVRTLSAPDGIVVIGWDNDTLRAVVFRRKNQFWVLSAHYLNLRAENPSARAAVQDHVLRATDDQLRAALLQDYGRQLTRELNRLGRAAPPPPSRVPAPQDPLAALFERYAAVWYQGSCKKIDAVYDTRVTFHDVFGDAYDLAGLRQRCTSAKPRACRLLVREHTTQGATLTVRAEEVCSASTLSSAMPKTFEVIASGAYRIVREAGNTH